MAGRRNEGFARGGVAGTGLWYRRVVGARAGVGAAGRGVCARRSESVARMMRWTRGEGGVGAAVGGGDMGGIYVVASRGRGGA
jgi:hypothetical protein